MALTRAEAIDLAVMRHLASREDKGWMRIWVANDAVPTIVCQAIRAHYRAIVRTYGLQPTPFMVYDPPEYDGHSVRI